MEKQLPLFTPPTTRARRTRPPSAEFEPGSDYEEQLPLFSLPSETQSAPAERAAPPLTALSGLHAAVLAWGTQMKDKRSPNTIKAFSSDLKLLADYLGPQRNLLNQITTRDLNNWLQDQRSRGAKPKTYARRVTSVKSFFRWLNEIGVLGSDPAAPVIQHTVLSPLPEYLTEAEVQAALAAALAMRTAARPDPRPHALFSLLLQTGIKKSECLNLKLTHIDLAAPEGPLLWVRYPQPNQRWKERKLRLDPSWEPVFQEYAAYLSRQDLGDNLFPWSARRLEYLLEDIGRAAGLKKHLSFEMCRWTCAVREMRAGLDEDRLRQKLGLSKIQWREIRMKLKKLTGAAL